MRTVELSVASVIYAGLDVPDDCTVGVWKKLLGQGFLGDKILYSTKLTCHGADKGKQLEDGVLLPLPPNKMYVEGPGSVVKMLELALRKKLGGGSPTKLPEVPASRGMGTPAAGAGPKRSVMSTSLNAKELWTAAGSRMGASRGASPGASPGSSQASPGPRPHPIREGGEDKRLRFCRSGLQGMRPYMEDRTLAVLNLEGHSNFALFGVFDGHGGQEVAELAIELFPRLLAGELSSGCDAEEALRRSFRALDEELRGGHSGAHPFDRVGSTAVVVLVQREATRMRLLCANCGDSRAVLCRKGGAVDLSVDQKPQNPVERRRIEAAGGSVERWGPCWRIDAGLNLSRALGDFAYKANPGKSAKEQKVIAEPEIQEFWTCASDDFIIIGSDGVFEVHSSESLVQALQDSKRRGATPAAALEAALQRSLPSGDNVSLCMVEFLRG